MKKEYHFLLFLERYFMNYFKKHIQNLIEKESTQFNLWLPIVFGLGIASYFCLPFEPKIIFAGLAFILSTIFFILTKNKSNISLFFLICIFFFAGFTRIAYKTQMLNPPFIQEAYNFVQITGTVEKVDYRTKGYRVTLKELKTTKIPKTQRPVKVRITVQNEQTIPDIGDKISIKANLIPVTSAWYPNGYDFARYAYYEQIGALGFALGDLKILEKYSIKHPMEKIRKKIITRIQTLFPNDTGAIISALITGEQGAISKQVRENYSAAGIVHILSVSGFHMALIAGFVFAFLRFIFSLIPPISLKYNTKKICAVLALILTFLYLLISGMAIPAVRSFLMISFILLAVLFDRQALSVRSLSWAGFLILLIYPQELMTASFALSFWACYGLIIAYDSFYEPFKRFFEKRSLFVRCSIGSFSFFFLINLLIYCIISPIVIYHFNRLSNYTLLGNFCTSALFSLLIMPLLLFAVILMPLGIDKYLLLICGFLIDKINALCEWIANLPYAYILMPPLSDIGYTLFLLGILWICCWKTKIRYVGMLFSLLGILSVFYHQTPDIIISQNGKNVVLAQNTTFITNQKANFNLINNWFERNGLKAPENPNYINTSKPIVYKGLHIDFTGIASGNFDLIINNQLPCPKQTICIGKNELKQKGTHILFIKDKNIQIQTSADKNINRPWYPIKRH